MSLAKAVVTGYVYRNPETGYSSNNVSVSSIVLNIGDREEMLVRVLSKRTALTEVVQGLSKGDKILVEGRLQVASVKSNDGTERRIYEIDANAIELMSGDAASSAKATNGGDIVKFGEEEFVDELISEDEIPF